MHALVSSKLPSSRVLALDESSCCTCPSLPDARPRRAASWRLRVGVGQLDAVGVEGEDPGGGGRSPAAGPKRCIHLALCERQARPLQLLAGIEGDHQLAWERLGRGEDLAGRAVLLMPRGEVNGMQPAEQTSVALGSTLLQPSVAWAK